MAMLIGLHEASRPGSPAGRASEGKVGEDLGVRACPADASRVDSLAARRWCAALILFFCPFCGSIPLLHAQAFVRGDGNGDGVVNLSDPVFTLGHLFVGGKPPSCREASDANADGEVDLSDAIYTLSYLFLAGTRLPPPFPGCGIPARSTLGCDGSPCFTELDYFENIASEPEFYALSAPVPGREDIERAVKFLLPVGSGDPPPSPLYQNTTRYPLHFEFLRAAFPERLQGFDFEEYLALVMRRSTREYFAGTLRRFDRTDGSPVYGYDAFFDTTLPGEALTLDEVRVLHEALSRTFALRPLVFAPEEEAQAVSAATWDSPDVPIWSPSPRPVPDYEPYTPGTAYGWVRVFDEQEFQEAESKGRITEQDILVLEVAPLDIEHVIAALITGSRQNDLSHLAVRLARRGTPNVYRRDAGIDLHFWVDRLVHIEFGKAGFEVREASAEAADAWWAAHRPAPVRVPEVEDDEGDIADLAELSGESWEHLIERYGGKTAHLAQLHAVVRPEHRLEGFGIPFGPYLEFTRETEFLDTTSDPPRRLSIGELIGELNESVRFRTDAVYRRAALAGLRRRFREEGQVSESVLTEVRDRILSTFGSGATKVRFRSSSNAEDTARFPGAGLYDSFSACRDDDIDEDEEGPSRCDGAQESEQNVESAIRRVWASLWNMRAWEEREYFGIRQEEVAMAVLVTPAFSDELANGVLLTGDPFGSGDLYIVNAQAGNVPVVQPASGELAEKDLLLLEPDRSLREIARVRRSTLTDLEGYVLTDEHLEELARSAARIERALLPLVAEPGLVGEPLLEIEFKLTREDEIVFKQIRPFLQPEETTPPP